MRKEFEFALNLSPSILMYRLIQTLNDQPIDYARIDIEA